MSFFFLQNLATVLTDHPTDFGNHGNGLSNIWNSDGIGGAPCLKP